MLKFKICLELPIKKTTKVSKTFEAFLKFDKLDLKFENDKKVDTCWSKKVEDSWEFFLVKTFL